MGGVDKSQASIAGRPALRWAIDAMRGAAAVRRIIVVTAPDRLAELQASLDARGGRLGRGGRRPATGLRGARRARGRRGGGPRPRRGTSARDIGARRPGRRRPPRCTAPRSRSCPSPTRSSRSRTAWWRAPPTARPCSGRRRRRGPSRAAAGGHRCLGGGPDLFGDEQELLARDGVPVVTVPGEPAALKITEPADLDAVRALARDGSRPRQPAYGSWAPTATIRQPRRPAPGRPRIPGGTSTAWPLGRRRRRSMPSATGCWPRRGWATWAACSPRVTRRRGASTAASCCARSSPGSRGPASGRCPWT